MQTHAFDLEELRQRIGTAWFEEAACRGMDPDLWFPPRGALAVSALAVCERCSVRYECLVWGLEERLGIWGGRHERWRRNLRRRIRVEGLRVLEEDARKPVLKEQFCNCCRRVVRYDHRCDCVA